MCELIRATRLADSGATTRDVLFSPPLPQPAVAFARTTQRNTAIPAENIVGVLAASECDAT